MADDLTFLSPPRVSLDLFTQVLRDAGSPASPQAAACYRAITTYGIDPALGLAFFQHESGYGLQGVAARTRNWGNLRRGQGREVRNSGGWAWYATWADSAADWAALMADFYVAKRGLATVRHALPVYAPSSDGNMPARYADAVVALVRRWQAQADVWAAWGTAYPLPDEQRGYAIPRAWAADAGRLGAATTPELCADGFAARAFERGVVVWYRDGDRIEVRR